jgi:hypothetical protein
VVATSGEVGEDAWIRYENHYASILTQYSYMEW